MSDTKPNRQFLHGLLTAATAVAEITGKMPMAGMSEQTWKLICDINCRLTEIAAAEAKRLDDAS